MATIDSTEPSKAAPGGRYVLLDAMRGIAAIIVMLGHFGWSVGLEKYITPHYYLAVDFFFLLSGFVIADAYLGRIQNGRMDFGAFVLARLVRLYPMIFVGTCLGFVIALFLEARHLTALTYPVLTIQFAAGLMLEPFLPSDGTGPIVFRFPQNSPIWSLFWEIIANMGFAAVALRARPSTWYVITAVFALILVPYCLTHNGLTRGPREWAGGFTRVGFFFFCGICLWQIRQNIRLPKITAWPLIAVLIMLLIPPLLPHVNMLYDLGVAMICFPAIILLASQAQPPRGLEAVSEWLGAISYPLYALHYPLMPIFKLCFEALGSSWLASLVVVAAAVSLVLVTSYVMLVWFDEPIRAWLRRRLAIRPRARAQTAP